MDACSILVVADDFTGACDTGLQFASAGLHAVALIAPDRDAIAATEARVVVVDTETRQLPRVEAGVRVAELCREATALAPEIVYKKVDSALRGNLATEIRAAMDVLGRDLCLMAPALPASGRVTVGGYHLVHGVPVDRTEVGRDPGSPVGGAYLPHLLDVEPSLSIRTVALEDVADGAAHLVAMFEGLRGAGPTVIVVDAASDDDLKTIAEAAARLGSRPMLCGSAGLASHLVAAFGVPGTSPPAPVAADGGHALVIVGTTASTTRSQVTAFREACAAPEWEVHVDMTAFAWERPHLMETVDEIATRLQTGDAVLSLVGLHEGMHRDDADHAMRVLAELVRRVLDRIRPGVLAISGGWTAVSVLRRLEAHGAEIAGGVEHAVPVCRIRGGAFEGLTLVTKGGALGEPEVFVRAARIGRGARRRPGGAQELPVLGVTMGDPCGVGPEVIAKAFTHDALYEIGRPFVIGDAETLRNAIGITGAPLDVRAVERPEAARFAPGTVDVYEPIRLDRSQVRIAQVCREAGRAAAEWVIEAVDLAMAGRIGAIVTAPLNKEAMNLAGYAYAGHTELLAERSGASGARLMLASDRLCVSHVTGHVALSEVPGRLTRDLVFETISLTRDAILGIRGREPRLAVCGLNPHAGENGLFGDEDQRIIRPAVERGLAEGWDLDGPLPADTTFFKVYDGLYDGVVAMYHDQGHVPAKLVAFADAVNVTLGLPIIRTSVDHGTAFDIAGTGTAREGNLLHAARLAGLLARQRT